MTKTPYELRAQLLSLAFEVCQRQAEAKAEINVDDKNAPPKITAVTAEQIIEVAAKFNEFVSKNDSKG